MVAATNPPPTVEEIVGALRTLIDCNARELGEAMNDVLKVELSVAALVVGHFACGVGMLKEATKFNPHWNKP